MIEQNPEQAYSQNLQQLDLAIAKLTRKKSLLAWLRLFSFLLAVATIWLLWPQGVGIALGAGVIALALFFFFVSKDLSNNATLDNTQLLLQINQKELATLAHSFIDLPAGESLKPAVHDYAHDLDIFGRSSIYQYINRTQSEQGNLLVSSWLLAPATIETVNKRQEAIKELSVLHPWRQQLQATGIHNNIRIQTEQNIHEWILEKNLFLGKTHWHILRFVLPALSFLVLFLHLTGVIGSNRFYPLMLLALAIAFSISKLVMPAWGKLNRINAELGTLSSSIALIEQQSFNAPLLHELKARYTAGTQTASSTMRSLQKILDRLDYRLNIVVFIPLSIFLYWDLQQILALEKWKLKNKKHIDDWFSALASFEALSTLANLSYNHPQWAYPVLTTKEGVLIADEMGHPLIPADKRVDSSFSTQGNGKINLVTGSNMAGKSTFLRSTGVNIVLAMMGAPVCAKSFTLSPMKVMSSMRVSDNLEESTSTFYAELKKLKEIIAAVNRKEKVFLLLDEILRGTNSADRHTGSKALIKQLIQHNAVGMVATHDLELAELVKEYPDNIHNYHFDVQVANEELYFDYKLKAGVCTSMNASILMKKIGIEL